MSDETAPVGAQPFVDTIPVGEGADAAETQGERGGRRRNRRGRGGRERDETQTVETGDLPVALADAPPVAEADDATGAPSDAAPAAEGEDRDGRRRGRGRDRQRRERRDETGAAPVELAAGSDTAQASFELPAVSGDLSGSAVPIATVAAAVEVMPATPPVAAPMVTAAVVEPFVLPAGDLHALAEGVGLEWVGSDAEKIRAVQEAMANEPKPLHVPRERKPLERIDEGPLVLVETRKDLSQITLPFDVQSQQAPH